VSLRVIPLPQGCDKNVLPPYKNWRNGFFLELPEVSAYLAGIRFAAMADLDSKYEPELQALRTVSRHVQAREPTVMAMVVPLLLKSLTGVLRGCHFHEELNHINFY